MHLPGPARRDRVARPARPTRCCGRRSPTTTRCIFFEHKGALRRARARSSAARVAELGKAAVVRPGRDVTIVATLLMVERALAAADDARRRRHRGRGHRPALAPAARPARRSAPRSSKTGRLVVAEEQVHAGGWGATLISELTIGGVAWASRAAARQPARRLPDPVHAAPRGPDRAVGRRRSSAPLGRRVGR